MAVPIPSTDDKIINDEKEFAQIIPSNAMPRMNMPKNNKVFLQYLSKRVGSNYSMILLNS